MHIANKILSQTYNRQYPLPKGEWKAYQEWHNVLMLHWKIPVEYIADLLPEGLEPDIIDGHAWISWLSFNVENLRGRHLPSLPYVSNFEEVNLRTYVTQDGRPGIYMLSVEANKLIPIILSRLVTGIPYVKSAIERNYGCLKVFNYNNYNAAILIYYSTESLNSKAYLDYWLTERHSLYISENKKLYCYNIHHKEWNLNDVTSIDFTAFISTSFTIILEKKLVGMAL